MYKAKLAEPRQKRHSRSTRKQEDRSAIDSSPPSLQQPFPVPISSLTGIKADNSVWRWYRGNLKKRVKRGLPNNAFGQINIKECTKDNENIENVLYYVEITPDNEAHSILSQMGFFGETEENLVSYRNASKLGLKEHDTYVVMEDFEPKIALIEQNSPTMKDIKFQQCSSENRPLRNEDSDKIGYLRLELCEAFFLSYGLGCLIVNDCDDEYEEMSIDEMWDKFCRVDLDFPHKYAVYHHFRSKGWVVKDGCKFGADFLLYKDGPPFYHASYSVCIRRHIKNKKLTSDTDIKNLDWTSLAGLNRVTESASKELLLIDVFETDSWRSKGSTVTEYMENITLEEILVRRWVASCEKNDLIQSKN